MRRFSQGTQHTCTQHKITGSTSSIYTTPIIHILYMITVIMHACGTGEPLIIYTSELEGHLKSLCQFFLNVLTRHFQSFFQDRWHCISHTYIRM